jgi:fructose-1,6-bisphosphatase
VGHQDARLLDRDAKETRFAAIAENLLRRKLNPIEKAKGFEQVSDTGALEAIVDQIIAGAAEKVAEVIADLYHEVEDSRQVGTEEPAISGTLSRSAVSTIQWASVQLSAICLSLNTGTTRPDVSKQR